MNFFNDNNNCEIKRMPLCFMGPTGPRGATGPTGPTGPTEAYKSVSE